MIKHYCDQCGDEISKEDNNCLVDALRLGQERLTSRHKYLGFKVTTGLFRNYAKVTTWNEGDFCKYCVAEAITNFVGKRPVGKTNDETPEN